MCALFYIDKVNMKINDVLLRLNRCRFLWDADLFDVPSSIHVNGTTQLLCVKEGFCRLCLKQPNKKLLKNHTRYSRKSLSSVVTPTPEPSLLVPSKGSTQNRSKAPPRTGPRLRPEPVQGSAQNRSKAPLSTGPRLRPEPVQGSTQNRSKAPLSTGPRLRPEPVQGSAQNRSKAPLSTFSAMPRGLTEKELDEQFQLFLQEPVSDESLDWSSPDHGPRSRAQRPASWCEEDEGSQEDEGSRPGQCREPQREGPETAVLLERSRRAPLLEASGGLWSSGSLSSLPASDQRRSDWAQSGRESRGPAADAKGLDTLEEEEEKSKFFAKLEAEVSSLDYSKLVGALDWTGRPAGRTLRKSEEAAEPRGEDEEVRTSPREHPAAPASLQDNEEEEEASGKEEQVWEEPGGLAEGQRDLQAAAVEVEAVREAFRQVQELSDGDDQLPPGVEGGGASSSPALTPSQDLAHSGSTAKSADLPTAAELLRPICPEEQPTPAGSPSATGPEEHLQADASVKLTWRSDRKQPELRFLSASSLGLGAAFPLEAAPPTRPKASSSSAEAPVHKQTWSLRQEVDQDTGSSHLWPPPPAAARRPHHWSTSASKPSVGPTRGRRVEAGASRRQQAEEKPSKQQQEEEEEEEEGAAEVLQQQRGSSSWTRASASQLDRLPPKDGRMKEEGGEERKELWSSGEAEQKFQQMQKEIAEQERLLQGYQRENEKLYLELKAEKARSRAQQEALVQESRDQLRPASTSAGGFCSEGGAEHTWALLAEISRLQMKEKQLGEDVDRLRQENQALLATGATRGAEESKQQLEAADAARLKAASADIQQLKAQVEQMKLAVSNRSSDLQQRGRGGGGPTQRVKQLERQVGELQRVLRTRVAPPRPAPPASQLRLQALLELKVQRLEAELEKRNQEAQGSFQAMEQRFQALQARYQQHVCELQQRLEAANAAAGPDGQGAQLRSPEGELRRLEAADQERERALRDEIQALQQQLAHKARSGPAPRQQQAQGVRIERLNKELSAKTRTIQELSRCLERLQKERSAPPTSLRPPQAEPHSTETRRPPGAATPPKATPPACSPAPEEAFAAAGCQKTYRPAVFTDSHISDVLQENEALKHRLQLLELRAEQEKEALRVEAAEAREQLLRMQEGWAAQQRASVALQQASAQVAQLSSQLQTQQVKVSVLQEQLQERQAAAEELQASRRREEALQQQLGRLLGELREAQEAQSPEVQLLCSLEGKLVAMELRHQSREQELQQVIGRSWRRAESEEGSQAERWRRVAEDRSRQLEAFRQELDSILELVRCLQREGVALAGPAPAGAPGPHPKELR